MSERRDIHIEEFNRAPEDTTLNPLLTAMAERRIAVPRTVDSPVRGLRPLRRKPKELPKEPTLPDVSHSGGRTVVSGGEPCVRSDDRSEMLRRVRALAESMVRIPARGLTNLAFPLQVARRELARVPARDARVPLLSDCVHNPALSEFFAS